MSSEGEYPLCVVPDRQYYDSSHGHQQTHHAGRYSISDDQNWRLSRTQTQPAASQSVSQQQWPLILDLGPNSVLQHQSYTTQAGPSVTSSVLQNATPPDTSYRSNLATLPRQTTPTFIMYRGSGPPPSADADKELHSGGDVLQGGEKASYNHCFPTGVSCAWYYNGVKAAKNKRTHGLWVFTVVEKSIDGEYRLLKQKPRGLRRLITLLSKRATSANTIDFECETEGAGPRHGELEKTTCKYGTTGFTLIVTPGSKQGWEYCRYDDRTGKTWALMNGKKNGLWKPPSDSTAGTSDLTCT